MKINKIQSGSQLMVVLEGRLDTTTAPELDATLSDLSGVAQLDIDMANLNYISSAGLRSLLSAQKKLEKNGGNMTVLNVSDDLQEIFEVTGFDEILNIKA